MEAARIAAIDLGPQLDPLGQLALRLGRVLALTAVDTTPRADEAFDDRRFPGLGVTEGRRPPAR